METQIPVSHPPRLRDKYKFKGLILIKTVEQKGLKFDMLVRKSQTF